EVGAVHARRIVLDLAVRHQHRVVALDDCLRQTEVVLRADLRVRLPVAAVALDARVEAQPVPEREPRAEPELPRGLRVAPEHLVGLVARHDRAALLLAADTASRVTERLRHEPAFVDLGRHDPVHEDVGEAEADPMLGLPARTDELDAAQIHDAVAHRGELRVDLPREVVTLDHADAYAQLVPPRVDLTDVHDLRAAEAR